MRSGRVGAYQDQKSQNREHVATMVVMVRLLRRLATATTNRHYYKSLLACQVVYEYKSPSAPGSYMSC